MTLEEKVKAALGEMSFQMMSVVTQLEAANAQIAELTKKVEETKPKEEKKA